MKPGPHRRMEVKKGERKPLLVKARELAEPLVGKIALQSECSREGKPIPQVKRILRYKKSGAVLDLGCGKGRNALFLARKGFEITGVDGSSDSINGIKRAANEENLKVEAICKDIREYRMEGKYDVVTCNAVLHFLSKEDGAEMIGKMQEHTASGGLNVITVFMKDNPRKPEKDHKIKYLFEEKELEKFYKKEGWKILRYKEYVSGWEKEEKEYKLWHRHPIASIIAQKP